MRAKSENRRFPASRSLLRERDFAYSTGPLRSNALLTVRKQATWLPYRRHACRPTGPEKQKPNHKGWAKCLN